MFSSEQAKKLLDGCVRLAKECMASDVHLSPGAPARIRQNGKITDIGIPGILSKEMTQGVMNLLVSPEGREELAGTKGVTDLSANYQGHCRMRINVSRGRKGIAIAMRFFPGTIPSMEELGLPKQVIVNLLSRQGGGIILVTGPTGSGKSTTLASIVDYLNISENIHIITIEAPVEYEHSHKRAIVNQRELPADAPNFASTLRDALRQDPDVIMVGEMRDLETIGVAVTAAETGHLVLSTLHTNTASATINRIIDAFPVNQQQQIRVQLSASLRAVISQRLIPRVDGRGRIAAYELMVSNSAIAAHIRDGKTNQIASDIQTGSKYGMQAFDASLQNLLQKGTISWQEAIVYAHDANNLQKIL